MPDPATERPLADQPWLRASSSRRLLAALGADGRPARFVGGCVRDGLLGRPATNHPDLDLTTPEPPERVLELLQAAGIQAIATGLAHGTVTAVIGAQRFEITTLRRDLATDGRHAVVAFTDDFREDAARRDFTINAMSCDATGRLFDYFGGCTDLTAGRVRFVGDPATRITEDHLRILRLFRFFAHYGRPPMDAAALTAAQNAAATLDQLSGERIQREMLGVLAAPNPAPTLQLMLDAGVLAQVLPLPIAHDRLARLVHLAPASDPLLRLAALLRPPPAQPDATTVVATRWRLSRRQHDRLQTLTMTTLPALTAPARGRHRDLHRLGAVAYADLIHLAATDSSNPTPALTEALAAAAAWRPQKLPVTGDDLLALGLPPGPALGRLLETLEAWWLDHDLTPDRNACLAQAQALLTTTADPQPGSPVRHSRS